MRNLKTNIDIKLGITANGCFWGKYKWQIETSNFIPANTPIPPGFESMTSPYQ